MADGRQQKKARTLTGKVQGTDMEKTASVLVERVERHPLYGKYIKRRTRLLIHDENNECKVNDMVIIESVRPISKRKSWQLKEVVRRVD